MGCSRWWVTTWRRRVCVVVRRVWVWVRGEVKVKGGEGEGRRVFGGCVGRGI